ncbi:MAG: glycosyltransferase family 2 protein [Muribaculaceae bacterium]|nr:glycosyltransferase family 2 protein [Muribaculaceae bacterium]
MSSDTLISVIVPVFNGERLISRALRSVVSQTLPEGVKAEIIVADDCSTDSTPAEAKKLIPEAEKAGMNMRVISLKEHSGSLAAYLAGAEASGGKWLARIDSDDRYPQGYLTSMLTAIGKGADMAVAPFVMTDCAGHTGKLKTPDFHTVDLNALPIDTATFSLWNKLIARQLIVGAKPFPGQEKVCRWDDLFIMTQVLTKHPTISASTIPYHYTQHSGSLTHSDRDAIVADRLRVAEALGGMLDQELYGPFVRRLRLMAKIKYLQPPVRRKMWKSIYPMSLREIMTAGQISLPRRLYMALMSV